jgi:Cytochrome P450
MVRGTRPSFPERQYKPSRFISGSIVYANVAGQPLVILSDMEVANELLDKKSAIYSDRPVLEMAGELAGFKNWTGFLSYGPRWKESRKYMHHAIGTRESLAEFSGLFESSTRNLLKAALRDPENLERHIRLYASFLLESGEAGSSFSAVFQFCRDDHYPHRIWL